MGDYLTINVIDTIFTILTWAIIIILFYKIFSKQLEERPKIWFAILATWFGLFSFSINIELLRMPLKLAVLPLGVWIMYWILKRKGRWDVYKKYAWLGFGANFLFIATVLTSALLHDYIYPKDDVTTFISNISEDVEIIVIHPSGEMPSLNIKQFTSNLQSMKKTEMYSERWYRSTYINDEKMERFPYLLTGTLAKSGSGLTPLIFLDADGKGLLISYGTEQVYFQSKEPIALVKARENND
ncbi:hypothetical protein [Bacillus sp. FJAT-45066]|uniref:hypothetical protein n=1 Tax=Bacillus sp. FJAT-45066 TaxID=2011010 RepID=UPI000BB97759|nr:hypothetical protein [Bacillus sp. FJAT-45066]